MSRDGRNMLAMQSTYRDLFGYMSREVALRRLVMHYCYIVFLPQSRKKSLCISKFQVAIAIP